jgi:transposase InsO family protein
MSGGYDCHQNALAERINGILKEEFLFTQCANKKDLEKLVAESVYSYNNERPYLSLDMQIPNEVHKKKREILPQLKNYHPKTVNLF